MRYSQHTAEASRTLTEFVYELLDAHDDTMRLARDQTGDLSWDAHMEYLRRLQRVGRELLARTDSPIVS
ncbi:MAG TPA: hypothetical protein VMU39_10955 [Solirubrobacteraceae bacterium]|nr:hypothetical protein [Solirubrobacteraceae bacterium]